MSERFDIRDAPLAGLKVVGRKPRGDARGFLERMYCDDELAPILEGRSIAQINRTLTVRQGTVRGLHYQRPPHAETKLVSCIRGEIFDVAVDLRRGSPTFLMWHAEVLSAANGLTFFIPEGFAHGFQCLTGECELLYLHSARYAPGAEAGIHPEDPRVGIRWPAPIAELSARDASHPVLTPAFLGIEP
ncbi:MAG: dTDP-4-dehydrorhamnose 3,5-epimerase-like enzyme [Labilithrix sp.]|nr:dTDP-4-dehydrorhamnose 3,5-epimerase-like enzyme [Labilithrix sp.]